MANKKKLQLGSIQANKLIAGILEKREKIKTQDQFRHGILESHKRVNYQSEFDTLQGAKRLTALNPNAGSRMKELQNKARQPLKGETHNIYRTKFQFIL